MLASIAAFEFRYHLARPITWIYLALFVAEGIVFMGTGMEVIAGGGIGTVARNAPFAIGAALLTFTAINQVIVTGLVGTSVLRDFQFRAHELLFTTCITKAEYLGGRFLGAFAIMALVHLGLPAGLLLGSVMPWVDASRMGPTLLLPYVSQYALLVLPTLVLTSTVFFSVGALTRSMFAIYTQGLVFLTVQLLTGALLADVDLQQVAALADPFGIQPFTLATRYWSAADKATRVVAADGLLLGNRVLWLGIAAALLAVTYALFRFRSAPAIAARGRGANAGSAVAPDTPPPPRPVASAPRQRFDASTWRAQLASTTRLAFWSIVREPTFVAIVVVGIVLLLVSSRNVDVLYAQRSWPVTYTVVEGVAGSFILFFVLLVTMFAGESVWRERQLKADQVVDALPTGVSTSLLGNLAGLLIVEALLLVVLMLVGMLIQTAKGYTTYEPALYLRYFFGVTYPALAQLTVLAFLVHVVVNQKFVGHMLMVAFWGTGIVLAQLGVLHPMWRYGQSMAFTYSDLYKFGPFVTPLALSALFWTSVAGLFAVLSYLLWIRGTESAWRVRRIAAVRRWHRPVGLVALSALLLAAGTGGVFYYNTTIIGGYRSTRAAQHAQAEYERTWKRFETLRLPRLVAVEVRADLEPERRAFGVSGTFTFVNKEPRALDSLLVAVVHDELQVDTLTWDRGAVVLARDAAGHTRLMRLTTPLAPGDTVRLRYRARYVATGFPSGSVATVITANGTYFRRDWFPVLGYPTPLELVDEGVRRDEQLPPRPRVARRDDSTAYGNAYMLGHGADWIDFRATVSTSPDQIAIAPGTLVREWNEGGRRLFEYVSHAPMSNDYAVLSARYAVRHEAYRGIDLAVFHHPAHAFNVDRMMASMKASLDYFTTHFGPYQFEQLRVVEFPRYAQYALALPGTIPFSEAAGFIARPGDGRDDLDMPFYVTAHEVAHQWWGHQVAGADVQGYAWLSEGLANYSALTVLEQRYGVERLQKFLAFELDQYLLGRGAERVAERPLTHVEGQPYIHYNKGSLALYALRTLIGEQAMSRALANFRNATAFRGPPYPTSADLMRFLAAETPDSVRYALTDLFETITLWDNRTEAATARQRPDGTYDVSLRVRARKLRSDSTGAEREVPMRDLIEVGVFGDEAPGSAFGAPLLLEKRWLGAEDSLITVVVRGRPRRAGIDPFNVLIDRDRRDNVASVEIAPR